MIIADSGDAPKKKVSINYRPSTNDLLTTPEIEYVNLFAKNYSDKEISNLLSIPIRELCALKEGIKKKFKTTSWLKIMKRCFDIDVLHKEEYIPAHITSHAMYYTSKILKRLNSLVQTNKGYDIQMFLLKFYESCKKYQAVQCQLNQDQHLNLSEEHIAHLKLIHLNYNELTISSKLKIPPSLIFERKRQLLSDLSANSYYNAIRIGLERNLISNADLNLSKTKLFRLQLLYTHQICRIKLDEESRTSIHDLIVRVLISFYAEVYYAVLFSGLDTRQNARLK